MAVIEVRDLRKVYAGRPVVDGVTMDVEEGEIFGVLGPNGAGKTTTVEVLEGYRRPDAGSVRVLGLDPITEAPALHPRIGVMLQEGVVYPGIRTREAIELFASYYAESDDPAVALERVGLSGLGDRTWRQLSGGEQRRLSLALALIGRPEVVSMNIERFGLRIRPDADFELLVSRIRGMKSRREFFSLGN